jgi:hypothetical protein
MRGELERVYSYFARGQQPQTMMPLHVENAGGVVAMDVPTRSS